MYRKLIYLTTLFFAFAISRNTAAQEPQFFRQISNREVGAFAQGPDGHLWIGTAHGLNRYNGSDYTVYFSSGEEGWLNNDNISSLCWDSDGKRLWIGSECGIGYWEGSRFFHLNQSVFDPVTRILETDPDHIVCAGKSGLFRFRKEDFSIEGHYYENGASWLENMCTTAQHEIWLNVPDRDSTFLTILGEDLAVRERLFLGRGLTVTDICERPAGTVWTATSDGLFSYDAGSRNKLPLPRILAELVRNEQILFLLPWRENSLLLGLAGKGMFSYNLQSGIVTQQASEQRLTGSRYRCFVDREGGIWLSDGQSDIQYYSDRQSYSTLRVSAQPERISHLCFDREGWLWMRCGDHLQSVDPSTGAVQWAGTDICSALLIDREGRLVSLEEGNRIVRYRTEGGIPHKLSSLTLEREAFSLFESTGGLLWISNIGCFTLLSEDGSVREVQPQGNLAFAFLMPCANTWQPYTVSLNNGICLLRTDGSWERLGPEEMHSISGMLRAGDGSFWLGTYNQGLYHYNESTNALEKFDVSSGMVDNTIKSVVEDGSGNIWFSTTTHISRYDVRTQTFATFHDRHFTGSQFYDLVSAVAGPDGKLYFGGSGMLTLVDPRTELPQNREIPLRLESIIGGGKSRPEDSPSLRLNWNENTLDVRAAGIDFSAGSLLNYAWQLEGYEKDWQYGSSPIHAIYSYLPAGSYTFRARVREQSGNWSPQEIALPVKILPSPWASPWAKAIYWILGLGLLGAGLWFVIRLRTQQERLALAEQREELGRQHIDFVTNISHEFRTPLSMIYAPAKELGKQDLGPGANDLVRTINRNAERLRNLSEQLLGSNGTQPGRERLTVRQNDLVSVVRSLAGNFKYASAEKQQTLSVRLPETLLGWFDTEKVGKIAGNLLSNALKYTPECGHITLALDRDGADAVLSVSDDGIGIPEDRRERIFERFERLGAEESTVIGSGIGLNYAQKLARLHKGLITFAPNEPVGSIFTFRFPVGNEAYGPDEIDESTDTRPVAGAPVDTPDNRDLPMVLVAEDTDEIREFLRALLSPFYRVVLASDGLIALDSLKLSLPDLVLSDVIMPNLTGIGLCNAIKSNPDWAHLPVVLLTAKADAESSIEGLRTGADAYIPKPFDPDYLLAVIDSQLANRRRIQERILNLTSGSAEKAATVREAGLSPADQKLLDRIHLLLDRHLENEAFNVAGLAEELGMSYSSLYAKIKALTGKTPQAYMTTYRMNIALELLRGGQYNVSEVSYRVGSSSPDTFSREFKRHFGYPPSQVGKTN